MVVDTFDLSASAPSLTGPRSTGQLTAASCGSNGRSTAGESSSDCNDPSEPLPLDVRGGADGVSAAVTSRNAEPTAPTMARNRIPLTVPQVADTFGALSLLARRRRRSLTVAAGGGQHRVVRGSTPHRHLVAAGPAAA